MPFSNPARCTQSPENNNHQLILNIYSKDFTIVKMALNNRNETYYHHLQHNSHLKERIILVTKQIYSMKAFFSKYQ
jgi:hypothetical protein